MTLGRGLRDRDDLAETEQAPCPVPPHPAAAPDQADGEDTETYLAESVSSRLGRWVRHAPAERAPLVAMPVTWTAAEILHAASVNWMGPGLVTVVAASWAYARASRKAARSEQPELDGGEMLGMIGVPGAWLTAATALGPAWGPFGLMSWIYLSVCGVGYRWLRRRDAVQHARAMRDAAAQEAARLAAEAAQLLARKREWHRVAARVGLKNSHLIDYYVNQNDSETWVIDLYQAGRLAKHVPCATVAAQLSGEKLDILGGWPVPMNRVEVAPDSQMAYRLLVTFRRADLWQGGGDMGLVWHPMASGELDMAVPGADHFLGTPSIMDPVVAGFDPETGEPMTQVLYDEDGGRRILVIGTSGSGKSMVLDTLRERITACPDAILLQINLSKGVEDGWWEPLTAASALASVHGDEADARALRIMDFVHAVANTGRPRKAGRRAHAPTAREPAFALMIDEVDRTANDQDRKLILGQIASKCRSEGIILILGSQRPQDMYVGGGMVRSNLSDLVWGRMRDSDRRQAGGAYGAALPNMGDYGNGLPGVFGTASLPLQEDMPTGRGRTFFWGRTSEGLIAIIQRRIGHRGGQRPYQEVEPGLGYVRALWAEITGQATDADHATVTEQLASRGDQDRYDLLRKPDGSTVQSGASVQRRLDDVAAGITTSLSAELRARMAAGEQAGGNVPRPNEQEQDRKPLPPREQALLWRLISQAGGLSGRKAAEMLTTRSGRSWSHTWVNQQLNLWEDRGLVERNGPLYANRWHPVPGAIPPVAVTVVPDPAPDPTAVGGTTSPAPAAAEVHQPAAQAGSVSGADGEREPDQVYGPQAVTPPDLIMMVAGWGLQDNDPSRTRLRARHHEIPDRLIDQALDLLRTDRAGVIAEIRATLTEAGAPIPSWAGGPGRSAETAEPGGEDDDLGDDDGAEPGGTSW